VSIPPAAVPVVIQKAREIFVDRLSCPMNKRISWVRKFKLALPIACE
jgi:hypothetical protein